MIIKNKIIVPIYLHGTKEDCFQICAEYNLDETTYRDMILDYLYEVKLEIEIDLVAKSSKLISVNGQKVLP